MLQLQRLVRLDVHQLAAGPKDSCVNCSPACGLVHSARCNCNAVHAHASCNNLDLLPAGAMATAAAAVKEQGPTCNTLPESLCHLSS
jgi:hypothetical protein